VGPRCPRTRHVVRSPGRRRTRQSQHLGDAVVAPGRVAPSTTGVPGDERRNGKNKNAAAQAISQGLSIIGRLATGRMGEGPAHSIRMVKVLVCLTCTEPLVSGSNGILTSALFAYPERNEVFDLSAWVAPDQCLKYGLMVSLMRRGRFPSILPSERAAQVVRRQTCAWRCRSYAAGSSIANKTREADVPSRSTRARGSRTHAPGVRDPCRPWRTRSRVLDPTRVGFLGDGLPTGLLTRMSLHLTARRGRSR
jgi:hypothetical protein